MFNFTLLNKLDIKMKHMHVTKLIPRIHQFRRAPGAQCWAPPAIAEVYQCLVLCTKKCGNHVPFHSLRKLNVFLNDLHHFELNWSSKLRDKSERKNTFVTRSCVLSDAWISRPQNLILRSRKQIRVKLILSQKLRYFRGSCFSQCVILSSSPHYSLPSIRFYANNYFE